jgi:predicted  nucleic acid-binding Zn-ribbon protein
MTGLEVILTSVTLADGTGIGVLIHQWRRRLNTLVDRIAEARSDLRKANALVREVHVRNGRLAEQNTGLTQQINYLTEELAAKQEVVDSGLQDLLKEPS